MTKRKYYVGHLHSNGTANNSIINQVNNANNLQDVDRGAYVKACRESLKLYSFVIVAPLDHELALRDRAAQELEKQMKKAEAVDEQRKKKKMNTSSSSSSSSSSTTTNIKLSNKKKQASKKNYNQMNPLRPFSYVKNKTMRKWLIQEKKRVIVGPPIFDSISDTGETLYCKLFLLLLCFFLFFFYYF